MVKELCDFLTAFKQFLYQAHLSAQGNAYAAHLLTEKIQNEVDKDIDRLKELYIAFTGDLSIANAQESLKQAELTLRAFLEVENTTLYKDVVEACSKFAALCCDKAKDVSDDLGKVSEVDGNRAFKIALKNAVDDVCEHCLRYKYLLDTEVQANGNSN